MGCSCRHQLCVREILQAAAEDGVPVLGRGAMPEEACAVLLLELVEGGLPLGRRREHDELVARAEAAQLQLLRYGGEVRSIGAPYPLEETCKPKRPS